MRNLKLSLECLYLDISRQKPSEQSRRVSDCELYCQELISGQNPETWDGTWDRFLVCRKVIILSDTVKRCSVNRSVKFTLSLLSGAKLKLTLTDCENITNQFATKREVVHHQKEPNVLKKLYSSRHTVSVVTLLENCVWNRSKARKKKLPHLDQLPRFSPRTSVRCPE